MLQYEEDIDPSLWERYIDKEKSGRMVSSQQYLLCRERSNAGSIRHIMATLVKKKRTKRTADQMTMTPTDARQQQQYPTNPAVPEILQTLV